MQKSSQIKPLVAIMTLIYNHEAYIRDALEGFVMQQTNFPFVAIVHDDASTDGSANIIREYAEKYPDIIKPIYETENQYSKHDGTLGNIMRNTALDSGAKYIALCEGDDYWTDPLKLQKQVDFLESHPNCSLTYHACKNVFMGPCKNNYIFGENVKNSYSDVQLLDYPFQTATIVYRKEILESDLFKKATAIGCPSGDVILCLTASRFGTIRGINEQMSVYRRQPMGISQNMHNVDKIWKNFNDWLLVALLFGGEIGKKIKHDNLSKYIYNSFISRNYNCFLKMICIGLFRSPITIRQALKTLFHHYYNKF